MRGWGSHRAARRSIRCQVIWPFWLRRASAAPPVPDDPSSEAAHGLAVVGHCVVVVVPLQDSGEPVSLFGDRVMHPFAHLGLDRFELRLHLLLARDPLELEPSAPA